MSEPSARKMVLLIDDDYGPMDYFKEAMSLRGLEVRHIDNTDAALEFIRCPESIPPDIFVIDIMMPHGTHLTAQETDDGLETGYFIIKECRKRWPSVPILCLSNIRGAEEERKRLEDVSLIHKFGVSPFEFADKVNAVFKTK